MLWRRSSQAANSPAGPLPTIRTVGVDTDAPFSFSIRKTPSVLRSRLRPQRALCIDIDGVERGLRGDEQPVALAPAETDVGDKLRDGDRADMGAVRRIAV